MSESYAFLEENQGTSRGVELKNLSEFILNMTKTLRILEKSLRNFEMEKDVRESLAAMLNTLKKYQTKELIKEQKP